jgi:phosphohistidine phosphatase SixA
MKKIIFSTFWVLIVSLSTFAQSLSGVVTIGDMNNGGCLALSGVKPNNGIEIILGNCETNLYKNWKLVDGGNGSYAIKNEKSGFCLGVSEAIKGSVSRIIQASDLGQSDTQWQFIETKDGFYKIQNLKTGLFLGTIPSLSELKPSTRIGFCPDDEKKYPIKWAVKPTLKIPVVKGLSINADGTVYKDGVLERTIADFNNPNYSVFVISRHAERAGPEETTDLTEAGKQRAQRLATILKYVPIVSVTSTNTIRTMATAKPTADSKTSGTITNYRIPIVTHIANIIALHGQGKKHLVIGHSDTIYDLWPQLTTQAVTYNSNAFDNLFVVVVRSVGNAMVYHFIY